MYVVQFKKMYNHYIVLFANISLCFYILICFHTGDINEIKYYNNKSIITKYVFRFVTFLKDVVVSLSLYIAYIVYVLFILFHERKILYNSFT